MIAGNNLYRSIVILAVLGLLLAPIPTNSLWWREAFNSGHTVLFIFLSFVIYQQIKVRACFPSELINYFFVLVIGILVGIVIEALQVLVQREASLSDLYRNFFGIMTALCFISVFNLKNIQRQKIIRVFFIFAATCFLILGINGLIQLSWHYIERNKAFPVIVDFDVDWSYSFVRFNDAEMLKTSNFNQKQNDNLHLVQFNPGEYPGIAVIEPEPDWSGYRKLCLQLFSMYGHDVVLILQVHDKMHNQNYSDRFNKKLVMQPGLNKYEITLSQVQHGAVHRQLDLTNIAGVILFSSELEKRLQFEVGNIYLE